MAYGEDQTTPLTGTTKMFSVANPVCAPDSAPVDPTSTRVEWSQTLDSLTGTIQPCDPGFTLNGTTQVSCDKNGKQK